MHPASVAPAACPADTPAAPKTPASSPPCAGRSRIVAPLPAGSAPPRTPLVAPVRIAPRLSSLRLQPSGAEDYLLPDFYSGAAGLSRRLREGFFDRGLRSCRVYNDIAGIVKASDMFRGATKAGKPITADGRTTLVFVKQGTQWKIVSCHF